MKKHLYTIALLTYTLEIFSQGVGINDDGSSPTAGAMLDIKSTNGGLLIPRMTEAQRDAISPYTQSMLIYQTNNDSGFYFYDGTAWNPFLIGGAAANSGWSTKGNTGTTPTTNFIGTIDSVDWVIRTDSTEQMRVTANGNVGLGTNSPNRRFHVTFDDDNSAETDPRNVNGIRITNNNSTTGTYTALSFSTPGSASGLGARRVDANRVDLFIFSETSGDFEKVTFKANGNIGIGTTTPTEKLHVVGNICYTGTSATCSDRRYKKDIRPIKNSLAAINAIEGIYYKWKTNKFTDKAFSKNRQIGFIAQEVEKYFPEVVLTDDAGYKSVDYGRLTPVLFRAIKEQQEIIEQQAGQMKQQYKKMEELKSTNVSLLNRVDKIEAILNQSTKNE